MSKGYSFWRDFYLLIMITVLLLCPDSVSLDTITIKYLWSLFNIHNFSGILSLFVSFSGLHRDLNPYLLDFSFESFKGTLPWALRSLFLIVFYVDSHSVLQHCFWELSIPCPFVLYADWLNNVLWGNFSFRRRIGNTEGESRQSLESKNVQKH